MLNQLEHYGRNAEKTGMDRKAFWASRKRRTRFCPGTRRRGFLEEVAFNPKEGTGCMGRGGPDRIVV